MKERKKGIRKANRSCKKSTKQSPPLFLCLQLQMILFTVPLGESSHENGQSQRVESKVFCQILKSWRWCWRLYISRISPNHVFIAGFWEVEVCQKQMRSSYFWSKCIPLEYYFLSSVKLGFPWALQWAFSFLRSYEYKAIVQKLASLWRSGWWQIRRNVRRASVPQLRKDAFISFV